MVVIHLYHIPDETSALPRMSMVVLHAHVTHMETVSHGLSIA